MLQLRLLTAADCHLCAHARRVLARLSEEFALAVEERPWDDDRTAPLLRQDGVPFPPALYLGDRLLAYGRLSERGLRRRLEAIGAV